MAREKVIPTGRERVLREDDFIVSKTNPKGIITYGNLTFIEFSGYTEAELLGRAHNIVRHPDMPKAVFSLMWDVLKEGQEFFGYVKNLAKDGSHYWTFANVTPSLDEHGRLLGYFSVRRKPRKAGIETMEPIYRSLLETEQRVSGKAGIAAAREQLLQILNEKGMSYHDFIFTV